MNEMDQSSKPSGLGLLPFLAFIFIYLGSGVYFQMQGVEMAFYQVPGAIAISLAVIFAFIIFKGSINQKINTFLHGCGDNNIIIMCMIYLLAGAFATVSSVMGGVDATANLGLMLISPQYMAVGVFIITMFISLATGTSVGSIVAIGPIAVDLAQKSGISLPIMLAAVMGGAMFGDDLSVISDTTIAATRTQGVDIRDKFRANVALAIPAVVFTIIMLLLFGRPEVIIEQQNYNVEILKVIPYVAVLALALAGVNVFVVLVTGIFISIIIGLGYGNLTVLSAAQNSYEGFKGMMDIFLLSMITGGLARMVTKAGGVAWILQHIQKMIRGRKSAELGIGLLAGVVDLAVANNTVAIIVSGQISKNLSDQNRIDPRRAAGLLSVFSCIGQAIIPYGAQMLILLGFAKGQVSPFQLIPLLWYQQALLVSVIVSIFVPFYKPFLDGNFRRKRN